MSAAEAITTNPFTGNEPAFESETVKSEYEQLCRDHQHLIEFGENYGNFDEYGKLYFLDQMEAVQERWDIFFARFQLLGAINPKYVQQCNTFLEQMSLTETDYRELLRDCHNDMRQQARDDGMLGPYKGS